MSARLLAAMFASTILLAACGGGGGTGPAAPPIPAAAPTVAPQATGTIPMSISIPLRTPSSTMRGPLFLSPGASSLAIYDGTTLVYVANLQLDSTPQFVTVYARGGTTTVAFGSCTFTSSRATCTLTLTTTIGQHAFDLIAYPANQSSASQSTPPVFTGVISSEGELSANLSPGTNAGQTLTMLGVADKVIFAGLSEAAFNSVTTYGYRIEDSTNSQIVQPGAAYDNGPVTITASPSGIVTIAPNSIATPPAAVGDQNFDVTCVNSAGGSVTISFNTRTSPNTAYASALTYSASNYSGATIQTIPFTCDPASATIPITVQGNHK